MIEHNFEQMRRAMVATQLRTTGTNDPAVLAAMGEVPRERFVPARRVAVAYADTLVPLNGDRQLNSPMALGRLLTEAAPEEAKRVLAIGVGTGYAAAVLARLVDTVIAVEEDPELAARAREALEGTGVTVIEGPLTAGYAAGGPYDLILIDGAVEYVPQALIHQLRDEGKLAAGIVENGVTRLALGRKAGSGFAMAAFADAATAILPSFAKPRAFTF